MTDTLSDLLHRSAEAVPEPRVDVAALVAEAGHRERRRRVAMAITAVAVVGAVATVSLAVRSDRVREIEPAPSPPTPSGSLAVDPVGTRPVVYAEGSTVHIGDTTVRADKPVAFIDVTDDGVVYEAALDGTLWFSDGTTSSVIGTSSLTAAPTARHGSVMTGDSGSLVVWGDRSRGENRPLVRFVVYDTSRRDVVAHIPFPRADDAILLYVGESQVYFTSQSIQGCWVYDLQSCSDPHLFRFDVPTGETSTITLDELAAELSTHPRLFVSEMPDLVDYVHPFHPGASFRQVGQQLVHAHPAALSTTSGGEVRFRLPRGYRHVTEGEGASVVEWLDDAHWCASCLTAAAALRSPGRHVST
jgi:hypothetical protein